MWEPLDKLLHRIAGEPWEDRPRQRDPDVTEPVAAEEYEASGYGEHHGDRLHSWPGADPETTGPIPVDEYVVVREEYWLAKRFEWYITDPFIPKWLSRDSFHLADGRLPLRHLTFRRRVRRRSYQASMDANEPITIMKSGWAFLTLPLLACLGIMAILAGCLALNAPAAADGIIALIMVVFPPLWAWLLYLNWWFDYYVIFESKIDHFWNPYRTKHRWWPEGSLASVLIEYRGGKITSLFWRWLRIGDAKFIDAEEKVFTELHYIADAQTLTSAIADLTTSTERAAHRSAKAAERTADATEAAATSARQQAAHAALTSAWAAYSADLEEARLRGVTLSDDERAELRHRRGLPEANTTA